MKNDSTDLINISYKFVGGYATLIVGLTPDKTGLLPNKDVQRLKEFGLEIKNRFDNPLPVLTGKEILLN